MSRTNARRAILLTALMLFVPIAQADLSEWRGPDAVRPSDGGSDFTALRIPTNATVLDSWMEISNEEVAQSSENLLSWHQDSPHNDGAFLSGITVNSDGQLLLEDDFSVSQIEDFDEGNYTIEMPNGYYYSPGILVVYSIEYVPSSTSCSNQDSAKLSYGYDNDGDGNLDSDEIESSNEYCPSSGLPDSITSLNITNPGSGYGDGNLSATGGGGSGFNGTYLSGRGIGSATLISGGSGYQNGTVFNVECGRNCPGAGANLTVTSVDSSGAITGISLTSNGFNYTTEHALSLANTGASGRQVDITLALNSTGPIVSVTIDALGSGYTSAPTIVPSGTGSGAVITPGLGGFFNWLIEDHPDAADSATCSEGGHLMDIGQDLNNDGALNPTEIQQTIPLCHNPDIDFWSSVLPETMNGSVYLDERTLPHGVVPATAVEGKVIAGTMPGNPVPAGVDTSLYLPPLDVPVSDLQIGYTLSFDHWYHVDSTSAGDGDGAWLEFRMMNGTWGPWSYLEPAGGYPSTLSSDGPAVPGQPSGDLPVFASPSHSGWTSENIDLTTLSGIDEADEIQFRFRLWTHPSSQNLRPGWFLDNISYQNVGGMDGGWLHGCSLPSQASCSYSNYAHGALQTQINTQGTSANSKIRLNIEYDLEGSSFDNYCVEMSTNNATWVDISSSTPLTSTDCDDRTGAIPGTTGDQSGGLVIQQYTVPAQFLNLNTVYLRILVDTDGSVTYGSPQDNFEGVFLTDVSLITPGTAVHWSDDLGTSSSFYHYVAPGGYCSVGGCVDDWNHIQLFGGSIDQSLGFENSYATAPENAHAPGWSTTGASDVWDYGFLGSSLTLQEPASFPYLYGTDLSGPYADNKNGYLLSPDYDIPDSGATLHFSKWSCMDPFSSTDGAQLQYRVNGGSWQHFQPSMTGWYDGIRTSTWNNPWGTEELWFDGDCGLDEMSVREAPLDQWSGEQMQFRFQFSSDTCCQNGGSETYEGFYVDDFGILIPNYSSNGSWTSPSVDLSNQSSFNMGFVDVDAEIPEGTRVLISILDSVSLNPVEGFDMDELPLSLAGIDAAIHPSVRIQVHLETVNSSLTPMINSVRLDGFRTLSSSSGTSNGWSFSPSTVIEGGYIVSTGIAGTIDSEYITSSRPIRALSVSGDYSGVSITFKDANGAAIGPQGITGGLVEFPWLQSGYRATISLSPAGSINQLNISAKFAEPARSPAVDLGSDGTDDWAFPMGSSYGNLGWQSMIEGGTMQRSQSVYLTPSNPATISVLLPSGTSADTNVDATSWAAAGFMAVSPVGSPTFDSPVVMTLGSASQSTSSSGAGPSAIHFNGAMISQINSVQPSITDPSTSRQWKQLDFQISSTASQTVTIATLGISYYLHENVSGLQNVVTSAITAAQSNSSNTDVNVAVNALEGMISIGGGAEYDYITTNHPFDPPNTFAPRAESYHLVTEHSHLFDNSQISSVTLTGSTLDGASAIYSAYSSDGDWSDQGSVSFAQSGSIPGLDLVNSESASAIIVNQDGTERIQVNWSISASWGPDDLSSISWSSSATDLNGETRWSAEASSGNGGRSAYENDLEIDSFTVVNHLGNTLSDQFSSMYPFPVDPGNMIFIEGSVRFQGSEDLRPDSADFSPAVDLSGAIMPLTPQSGGIFSGNLMIPSGMSSITLQPLLEAIGPTMVPIVNAEDSTIDPPSITAEVDSEPPVAGPIQILTPLGFQNAAGKIVDPEMPLSVYVTVSDADARASDVTLRYWRTAMDDANGDGIPDSEEYSSMTLPLSIGFSGEEQKNFEGIDLTGVPFNSPVYLYIEGTDWSGRTYQSGGTGGGPGASEAWATMLVAEDVETQILGSGFSLDRKSGYLLPGVQHTFTMVIDEPNGIATLDGIDVMLCDDGPTGLGKMFWNPAEQILSTPADSYVHLIDASATPIESDSILSVEFDFILDWNYPWNEGDSDCSPRARITDDLQMIAQSSLLTSLSWELDNMLEAVPTLTEDLTLPIGESDATGIYLMKGDSFRVNGTLLHAGSGTPFTSGLDETMVEVSFIYGSERVSEASSLGQDGTWTVDLTLPDRPPVYPIMDVATNVVNAPGSAISSENTGTTITVDSSAPTILFDQTAYPDSSLSVEESDRLNRVKVTLQISDSVGMQQGDLEVAWVFKRGNDPLGAEGSGFIPLILDQEQFDVYQGELDMGSLVNTKLVDGDYILFWVVSTDRAGNEVNGLGSEDNPKRADIRIMEFLPTLTNTVFEPTDRPLPGERVTVKTFWSNPGKRGGSIDVSLWQNNGGESWSQSPPSDSVELFLEPGSTSVVVDMIFEPSLPGVPVLYVIDGGDFQNLAHPVEGMVVSSADVSSVSSGDSTLAYTLIGLVAVITVGIGVAMAIRAGGGKDDDYDEEYDEEYD
ncbi:MAG: hypothetical protein ACJZ56_04455, partial [Candidatus Thalassarchaeaceae archaeon]